MTNDATIENKTAWTRRTVPRELFFGKVTRTPGTNATNSTTDNIPLMISIYTLV